MEYLWRVVGRLKNHRFKMERFRGCATFLSDKITLINFNLQDNASSCSQSDLEAMKQEILREMRLEINKMKQEIIEGEPDTIV